MQRSLFSLNMADSKRVLIVGGTRFSGLYLWNELNKRGHQVTLFNRGKTALKKLPKESEDEFLKRKERTNFINGNRQDANVGFSPTDLQASINCFHVLWHSVLSEQDLKSKINPKDFDVVYDMNGREAADTSPLVDILNGHIEQFIYMSSAVVYKKSLLMPHVEVFLNLYRRSTCSANVWYKWLLRGITKMWRADIRGNWKQRRKQYNNAVH